MKVYIIEKDTNYSPTRYFIRRTTDGMIVEYTHTKQHANELLKHYLSREG